MDELTYSRDISMWCQRVSLLVEYIRNNGTLIEKGTDCDNAYRKHAYWVMKIRRLVTESSILLDCVNQLCPALLIPHASIIAGKMYTDLELYHVISSSVGDMNPSDLTDYKIPTLGLTIWEISDRLSKRDNDVYDITLAYIKSFESSKPTNGSVNASYPIYGAICISDYELFHFWLSEECNRRINHKIAFPYTWFNAHRSMTMNHLNGRVNEYRTACMDYMNSIYDSAKALSPNAMYGVPPEQYIKLQNDKIQAQEERQKQRQVTREIASQNHIKDTDEAKKADRLHKKQLRENNRIIARCTRQRELAELREAARATRTLEKREREREQREQLDALRVMRKVLREAARATRIREDSERAERRRLVSQSRRMEKQEMREVNRLNKLKLHDESSSQVESHDNIIPAAEDRVIYIPGSRSGRAARERMIAQAMIASVLKNSTKIFAAADKNKRGKKPPIK